MDKINRRTMLAGAGALGASSVAAGAVLTPAVAGGRDAVADLTDQEIVDGAPMLVDIKDISSGEVEILIEDRSVTITDKALVARLLRAARA